MNYDLILNVMKPLPSEGGGFRGGRETMAKKEFRRQHGRSQSSPMFFMIRDVGCEVHDKIWMDIRGSSPQEGQRGMGISSILPR